MTGQTTTGAHTFTADTPHEYGYRPRCRTCGRERAQHLPEPRKASGEREGVRR